LLLGGLQLLMRALRRRISLARLPLPSAVSTRWRWSEPARLERPQRHNPHPIALLRLALPKGLIRHVEGFP
jgi:hypothetical protein